jgi:hypothetical protein
VRLAPRRHKVGPVTSLDEQKLSLLRAWGSGLERDEREEVAAAGRAILLLIDEVEQLHVELWHARTAQAPAPAEPPEEPVEEPAAPVARPSLGAALRNRLKSVGTSRAEQGAPSRSTSRPCARGSPPSAAISPSSTGPAGRRRRTR